MTGWELTGVLTEQGPSFAMKVAEFAFTKMPLRHQGEVEPKALYETAGARRVC